MAEEADTQLYSVGIFEPFEYRSRTPEELSGPSLLAEVTELTSGRAFTVENIGRARSDLRLLRLSIAGHRPFHVAHPTYLSSRKCLLVCDSAQDGHSLSWNHTCNPNSKKKVQRSVRCRRHE
jgi:hypothetical protein